MAKSVKILRTLDDLCVIGGELPEDLGAAHGRGEPYRPAGG